MFVKKNKKILKIQNMIKLIFIDQIFYQIK